VTFQFLILLVASWLRRHQGEVIEYLRAENRVLRARLGHERLRFTDAERRLLAEKGRPLGRKQLAEIASLATPEDVSIMVVERDGARSVVRQMPLNERGELVKAWPGGFFEEGLREVC
jgi:hypothetical protein